MTKLRGRVAPEPLPPAVRGAKMRAHAWRSVGVGAFTTWAVVLDRVVDGAGVGWGRVVAVFVGAAAAWFLVGSSSGILWSYLPQPGAPGRGRDRDRAV